MSPDAMSPHQILAEIAHLRAELARAADQILSATEEGLGHAARAPLDAEAVTLCLYRILEACSFQDLADQRIARLLAALGGRRPAARADDHLLNGPALAGQGGLTQAAVDAMPRD